MNIVLVLVVVTLGFVGELRSLDVPHSFYAPRPISQHAVLLDAGRLDDVAQQGAVPCCSSEHQEIKIKRTKKLPAVPLAPGHKMVKRTVETRMERETAFGMSTKLFYQGSADGKKLAQYFMPTGKSELVIKGYHAAGDRDISATWLRIAGKNDPTITLFTTGLGGNPDDEALYLNQFQSTISMKPEITSYGAVVEAQRLFDINSTTRGWFKVRLPIMHAETNMHFTETGIKNAYASLSDVPRFSIDDHTVSGPERKEDVAIIPTSLNATQAFNNPAWKFGKIKTGKQEISAIGNTGLILGVEWLRREAATGYAEAYVNLPTSPKTSGEYLGEPVIDNNGCWEIGGTLNVVATVFDNVQFLVTLNGAHILPNTYMRTFDLKDNGQWSRFLLVMDQADAGHEIIVPGVNIFTQPTRVEQGYTFNGTAALNYTHRKFSCEGGYNLWHKTKESLVVRKALPDNLFLAGETFGVVGNTPFSGVFELTDFPDATINRHTVDNHATKPGGHEANIAPQLSIDNFDVTSAAQPVALYHTLYAHTSCQGVWRNVPYNLALGASYEISGRTTRSNIADVLVSGTSRTISRYPIRPNMLSMWASLNITF